MGRRKEVSIISHRPVTRSDLKQERSFFRGSVSTVLQLVVATLARLFEVATLHSTGVINRQPYHKLSALSLYLFLYFT